MLNRWAHKRTASPGLAWPEVLQGTLISSRCPNDTEGRLTHAGREIKERKTGIRAIREHQKHTPALQQQRSAIDENMELPLTYPFRQPRGFFFQAADLQRDALGARDKEQDGSKHIQSWFTAVFLRHPCTLDLRATAQATMIDIIFRRSYRIPVKEGAALGVFD